MVKFEIYFNIKAENFTKTDSIKPKFIWTTFPWVDYCKVFFFLFYSLAFVYIIRRFTTEGVNANV